MNRAPSPAARQNRIHPAPSNSPAIDRRAGHAAASARTWRHVVIIVRIRPAVSLRRGNAAARAIVDSVLNRRGLSFAVVMSRQAGKNETSAQIEALLVQESVSGSESCGADENTQTDRGGSGQTWQSGLGDVRLADHAAHAPIQAQQPVVVGMELPCLRPLRRSEMNRIQRL